MDVLIADVIGDLALVLALAWLFGIAARKCGQPAVVGQIIAGIVLGPSLLGHLPGHLSARFFPHTAVPVLSIVSQVAVALFMFLVGYEVDWQALRRRSGVVAMVAASAFTVPMALGIGAALIFRAQFTAVGQVASGRSFVLFIGVAVSITALPVLAAIARERGIDRTPAGLTATSAAGMMDVAAWVVLAAALATTAGHTGRPWWVTLLLITGFAVVMLVAVRPLLRWWVRRVPQTNVFVLAVVLALASAWVTASIGLHPVFGGFLAGLTMPRLSTAEDVAFRRDLTGVAGLFLPLFFVVTGLSVNLSSLNGGGFALLALVCVIAVGGKLGPAFVAGRIGGLNSEDAATVAALVNSRGLTELIALNVGLTAAIIGPQVFCVLVVMAVLTTVVTSPLLALIASSTARSAAPADAIQSG
jgi:Kef-type K+ transport system membrane component KefB